MGTSGRLLKSTYVSTVGSSCYKADVQEYAGLPGSSKHAKYLKSTTHTQLSRALYPGSSIVRLLAFTVAKLTDRTTP
jgi:hypothetical protein